MSSPSIFPVLFTIPYLGSVVVLLLMLGVAELLRRKKIFSEKTRNMILNMNYVSFFPFSLIFLVSFDGLVFITRIIIYLLLDFIQILLYFLILLSFRKYFQAHFTSKTYLEQPFWSHIFLLLFYFYVHTILYKLRNI